MIESVIMAYILHFNVAWSLVAITGVTLLSKLPCGVVKFLQLITKSSMVDEIYECPIFKGVAVKP